MRRALCIALGAFLALQWSGVSFANTKLGSDPDLARACEIMAARGIAVRACRPDPIKRTAAILSAAIPPRVDPSVTPIPEKPPEPATGWFFMLRQDQYDQISYISRPLPFQVIQGASASYVQDQLSRTASLSSKGYLGVSAYNWTSPRLDNGCSVSNSRRPPVLQGFGAGGFIQANGNYTDPMSAGERSALRFGVNVNAYLCNTPVFPIQDVQMIPYYQTDFRGRAGITGFNMLWEPTYLLNPIFIGGRNDVLISKFVGAYARLIGEANVFNVQDRGLTNFMSNTTYAFIGGTAEIRAILFENNTDVPAALCSTISFVGSARYLWDAVAQKPVRTYGAEVGYRLTGTTNDGNKYCKKWIESPINTTIALSYNRGTDMMTFVKQDVYRVSLKFVY